MKPESPFDCLNQSTQEAAVNNRLHSTCRLPDGIHWMLIDSLGQICAVSTVGFESEYEALKDIGVYRA